MAKANNKTTENSASVAAFINSIDNERRRKDAKSVLAMMKRVTKLKAKMWGDAIVGFGTYHYKYESGREGDYLLVGFSPRKAATTLYVMPGFSDYGDLLAKLGKHKTSRSCLYIANLDDVDEKVLEKLVAKSFTHMKKNTRFEWRWAIFSAGCPRICSAVPDRPPTLPASPRAGWCRFLEKRFYRRSLGPHLPFARR